MEGLGIEECMISEHTVIRNSSVWSIISNNWHERKGKVFYYLIWEVIGQYTSKLVYNVLRYNSKFYKGNT